MSVIRRGDVRRTETPNAVMTTLASPTLGGAAHSIWRVDMPPGQVGPLHVFDAEQVWSVLDGGATVQVDGEAVTLASGDTIVLAAQLPRQVFADPRAGLSAIVAAPGTARASMADGTDRGVPGWIA
ncbi:MAG TPA: cupin domain-containing protein [Solirubrobacteraceae bacterium]|jgi:quercetin dioxygenase-like cupin family protein